MKVDIDINKIVTALVITALMTVGAAIWDVQGLKANVARQDDKIDVIYDDVKIIKAKLLGDSKEK